MAAVDSAKHLIREILRNVCQYEEPLTLLGLFYASKLSTKAFWNVFEGLRTFFWPNLLSDLNLVENFGTWAVVTGGASGIGKAYSRELARRGLNIVLISLHQEKLNATAAELEKTYGIRTCTVQVDFSKGKEVYCKIAKALNNKEVGILVNNVGVMYEYPMLFQHLSQECIWAHININIAATTIMTHLILPQMLHRRRGAIINIASSSAIKPLPLLAVYSASKAYIEFFSRSLHHEYSCKGIVVQTISPFYISTALTKFSQELQKPGLIVPSPCTFVRHAIRTLGHSEFTTGYWVHGILYTIASSVPNWAWVWISMVLHEYLSRNQIRYC